MPPTPLRYVGHRDVAMHVFGLWFCSFADFSLVQCAAVLNVFVGADSCCCNGRPPAVLPLIPSCIFRSLWGTLSNHCFSQYGVHKLDKFWKQEFHRTIEVLMHISPAKANTIIPTEALLFITRLFSDSTVMGISCVFGIRGKDITTTRKTLLSLISYRLAQS
jgi:hypothetical protein